MSDVTTKCGVCQSLVDEEDLFCANCGTQAPHEPPERRLSRQATHNFSCTGCGASMSYDASAGALRCPFCGSERLKRKDDARTLAPRYVVPFKVRQQDAVEAMRRYLGKGMWRPGDLSGQAMVVSMKPVYVPYWVFEAETHTYWTADTSSVPLTARGVWRPLTGEHRGRHQHLLVGASGALAPQETADLCPFDLSAGAEPEQVDLDNVTVEEFSLMRKYARPLARHALQARELQACQSYVPGRSRNLKVNMLISGLRSDPVLLPVWIMAYRYQDRVFRFLVNGQTGKATGQAPTSWLRILAAAAGGVVGVGVLLVLLRLLLGG